ncbi:MAG: alpha-L-rhamnosidase, partial [Deltaproteobacteria bacterium]
GDRARVRALLPVAEGIFRWLDDYADADGILTDVTGWVIIDWSSVSVAGQSSVLNALYARALLEFAEMSEWLGDAGRARAARDRHARMAAAFERFWDAERSLYVDHVVHGAQQRPLSQHAQASAIVAGLAPGPRVAALVDAMLDADRHVHATWSRAHGDAREPRPGEHGVGGPYLVAGPPPPWWDVDRQIVVAQPFFRYVVHDAVAAAGQAHRIPALCRDWAALLERSRTSWAETWYGGTTCHGWGSTPTRDLVTRTLGVEPAEAGFTTARVAPRLGDLDWARGRVPTPAGLLAVDARPERVEVTSPVPIEADIELAGAPVTRIRTRKPAGHHVFER